MVTPMSKTIQIWHMVRFFINEWMHEYEIGSRACKCVSNSFDIERYINTKGNHVENIKALPITKNECFSFQRIRFSSHIITNAGLWLLMPLFLSCVCHKTHFMWVYLETDSKTEMLHLHLIFFSLSTEQCQHRQEFINANMMNQW